MGNDVIQGGPVQKKFHLYSVDFPPFEISEFFIQLGTLLMYRVAVPLLLFISLLLSPPRLARWYLLLSSSSSSSSSAEEPLSFSHIIPRRESSGS